MFDLDDTLHDKRSTLQRCGARLFYEFDLQKYSDKAVFLVKFISENTVIQSKEVVFNNLAMEFGYETKLEQKLKDRFDQTFHNDAVPFSGVKEALKYLTKLKVVIGCVTNGRDFFQRNKIEALGLTKYFKVIVTSGETGKKKPDHGIFLDALSRMESAPENSVFCGDSLKSDMQPAKDLGFITVWKSSKIVKPDSVDFTIDKFYNFPSIWQAITKC
ncbi:MAG: HAD family hydrolase [Pseudomonadales bacterium]|nr:HAD family hydrolase [Pseudomonadales bacterium]